MPGLRLWSLWRKSLRRALLPALALLTLLAGSWPCFLGGVKGSNQQGLRSDRSQRLDPLRAGDSGYSDRVFEDLFDEDEAKEDDNGSFRQSREPRRMETDEDQPEIAAEFDPAEWDDLEVDDEEEEELPETEEELMQAVQVSDDEVDEFLAEFNAKPILQKEPGTVPLDPFEKDASRELDTFKEVRQGNRIEVYGRGMADRQMVVTLRDRLRMLSDHAKRGEWKEARYLMKGIWRRRHLRLPLGRMMWNNMIKAHANANRPLAAESWLEDMLGRVFQPDIASYNSLLKCYGQRGDFLMIEKWMRRMKARGVAPDMYSYGALVQSYVKAKDVQGAEKALDAMTSSGCTVVPSNTFAYNTLMKHYASEGEALNVENLFDRMKASDVVPDATSYLQMIRAHVRDPEGAAEWLKRMEEKGLEPAATHFYAVMSSHAKLGDLEGTEAWFRVMMDAGFRPEVVGFNILMSAAAGNGDTEGAEGVLVRMEDLELTPDVVTIGTMLSAFAKVGNATGATSWLIRAEQAGLEPDLNCYNQVIKACGQAGDADLAERMARRLLRNRLTPDVYTYNMLLNALARGGLADSAEFWVDHMQRAARWRHHDFPLDQVAVSYSEVLLAHVNANDLPAAENWLEQMLGEGIEPQARCYTALVKSYTELGDLEQAGKWLGRMTSWSNHAVPQNLLDSVETKRLAAVS